MTEISHHKDALLTQIQESYARITYTYTAHLKLMNRLILNNNRIKITQIVLSALSAGGFIGAMITDAFFLTCVGGFFSTALLAINLFFKDFNLLEDIKQHQAAADELWLIREQYISLLTDVCALDPKDIISRRDSLQERTYKIYKHAPKTDKKSYNEAQSALKKDEEQFFTAEEIGELLPPHLRVAKSNNDTSGV